MFSAFSRRYYTTLAIKKRSAFALPDTVSLFLCRLSSPIRSRAPQAQQLLPHPQPLLPQQEHSRSRMMIQQQLLPPPQPPTPLLSPQPLFPKPPQQHRSSMISQQQLLPPKPPKPPHPLPILKSSLKKLMWIAFSKANLYYVQERKLVRTFRPVRAVFREILTRSGCRASYLSADAKTPPALPAGRGCQTSASALKPRRFPR